MINLGVFLYHVLNQFVFIDLQTNDTIFSNFN